ncbi:MAG: hypothetical protein IPJ38_00765 [Dechloromonas sp.]|uniref:Uncharacterized protein n=1 Tax=Candidatus Dechloromonas phosphorivorans TaxID=2899244 RepID=A0A935JTX9_9RHOO|nr:hypothetical protein [Candidatus Dechloromonas phosphorivorans]
MNRRDGFQKAVALIQLLGYRFFGGAARVRLFITFFITNIIANLVASGFDKQSYGDINSIRSSALKAVVPSTIGDVLTP